LGQYKYKYAQKSQNSDDDLGQLVIVKKTDLSKKGLKFKYLVAQLSEDHYSKAILSERSITVAHYENE